MTAPITPELKLDDKLWTHLHYRQRMTKKQLQRILLDDAQPIRAGRLCDVKFRDLGAGVVEVWLEDAP